MAKKLLTKSEVIADISTNINDEVEQGISGKKLAGVLTNMVNYSEDASQILLSSGSAEHSLQMTGEVNIINDDNTVTTYVNDSVSMMSVTLGIGNSAGIGGWKYNAIRVGEENVDFYLTTNTNVTEISINPEEEPIDTTLLSGFKTGDKLSLIIKGVSYNDIFTIKYINNSETAVNGNKISVSRAEFDAVFGDANLETLFNSSGINSSINYSLFCLAKPSNVNYNSDIGKAAFAVGVMNNANNLAANASGYKTNAYGMFSTAEGFMNNASGLASHAEGRHTIATNDYEHSEGKYNLSIKDKTIHTVGIGYTTYSTDIQDDIVSRINAEEIHSNGDKYIYGIGGYDGTNSQTEGIKTVQEVVKDVEKKLDNCVDLTSEQTITAAKTFSAGISMNNTRIRKVKAPTTNDDAANKQYVDAVIKIANNAVQITYAELKSLRDAGKLVTGTQYRITDYTCTTTQVGTKSAGHIFDIIVTADGENTLNEVARAVKHEGDTYFDRCNLNTWKIWYRLDNDTNRFAWADGENGKGVIYRMIDEFNNDCPYDFKNIQFKHPNDVTAYPYYYYTFASDNIEANTDCSLKANYCYSNTIREYVDLNKRTLNSIIFVGDHCFGNSFGTNCYSNTFGNTCIYNSFGTNCYSNTFGSYLQYNSFGNYCYSNTLGRSCRLNNLGADCYFNTFGSDCKYNTFGNRCYGNVLGSICYSNSFGNECRYNTFGNYCHYNSFGNNCYYIKFASDKSATTKYNYYHENHFENGCKYIIFTGIETASSSAWVQNYNFAQGLQGTYDAHLTIDGKRNLSYEIYVSKDTDGKIKESVIAEFENKLGNCVDLNSEQTITAAKTFSGGVSMNNTRIRKVKAPTEDTDATNKGYVDSKVDAIDATKQDVLTAGRGIVIDDSNTISINFDPDIFKVVSTLPETPDAGDEKKIHLVPSEDVESGNAYDEYVYVDGSWEKIGSFRPSIDLSDFVDFTSEQTITATKTFSGGINMNSTKILNVATPTNGNDAANKQYVDTQILDNVKTISTSTAKDMEELRALIEDINNKIDATKPQLVEGITDKYHRGHLVKIKLKASFTGVDSLPDTLPSINFAPIKYNKEAVLSLTVDDCHASAFCNIWAAINGRPVASNVEGGASKNYFYHANQYLNGDIPNEIKGKSYNRMVYNDGLGGKRRYNYGIAVWPSVRTNNGSVQMESESMVDKNANNLYRFMSPYFTWTDYDLIKKYGVDLYQHNIGKEDYGSDKIIYNVITGIVGDSFTAFKKGGRFISAVMEPDGNAVYCDAAKQVKLIDVIYNQSTGVDMIPYNNEDMYKKIYKRYFDNIESVKSKIEALLSKDINEREWYHFCFHSVYDNTCDLLQFIHQTYGDRIWFASAQEVYEYQYMKKWADIKAVSHKIENGQYIVSFEIYLPFQENFTHKDMSINLSLPVNANLLNVECTSGDIPELEYIGINDTKTMIHVGVNEDLIDNIEYFVSKYEFTGDEQWKNDAIIDISRLREDLKQNYLSRLNKEPVYVTDIQISLASSSINKGETVNGTVTALPSNNTQMSDILLNIAEGATITSKSISGNIINFTVIGDTVGTTTITATIGDITNSVTLEINEVQTPIAQVEVSNLIVSPSSPNVGDNLEVSWTASKNGVTLQNGYIKIWTNLTPMPDTWTSVSNFSHTLNAEESLTTIYVKVASNVDGTDASATSVCTVKVNTPAQTVNAPIYMLSLNAGGVGGSNWHRYDTVFKHHVNTLYALSTAQFGGNGPVDDNGNGTSLRPMTTEQIQASECVTELLSLNSATWNIGNMSEKYSKIMTLFDETTNERGAVRAIYGMAYGSDTLCALGWTLDNGRYKIRLMSTYDSVSNDPYASCNYQTPGLGKIYFNKEDITSQLGTSVVSFADNTTWSDPVEVNIENGELIISIFNKKTSNASERTRMNIWGLEITKL